jgi:predicted ATPase/class 3 adenylate cyclase
METTSSFGSWIRRQRKALDLTQQALADRVGCSLAAIKKIEGDERRPSRQIAERLADVLGVPASQREVFLEAARGLRPADRLSLARASVTSSQPTGIVTFLFTDIEGSTKLASEYRETWEVARARHHAILREAIELNHGFVFQIIGDAFCAAFSKAGTALQAALQAQQNLQNEPSDESIIRVRMGIHTGEAEAHDNEYHGYLTLSLVQRLMSAGHGGQIILSHTTENLLRGQLPKDINLRDMGEHKFKDIPHPTRVFQVVAPDLESEFPPLRTLDVHLNNLPIQLTSFVGREKELVDMKKLLQEARLVTLTGPGGTGKTRLSIQIANELLDQYPDGVWLVELASILDPLLVPRTTAISIGLRDEPQRPVIDMLCDYLREKKMLILLDNCEHLVEACAHLADRVLHTAPQVRILASSREALGFAGEVTYRVPSLGLPDVNQLPSVESLTQYEAIQLFIDRATSALPTFTTTNDNVRALAQVCSRLDGIPLAIELAAAKVRVLSVEQIAKRLDDRFRLLTGGSRTALERHQTLRAAIDWSYNLLSPAEQILFRRLSIFVGGWALEAAESVCADESLQSDDVLNVLEQLINKSLVLKEETQNETRYHTLETMRQYANEKLVESGESDTLRDHHLDYFLNLAETAEPHLIRPEQLEWLARLDADYENLRAVLEWALYKESPQSSLRLCAALGTFWNIRWYWLEGSKWLESALVKPSPDTSTNEKIARIRALCTDAGLAAQLGNLERMQASAKASLALCEEGTDKMDIAIARFYVGNSLRRHGDDENALHLIEESLAEFQKMKDLYWEAASYNSLNYILVGGGEPKLSEQRLLQALEFTRRAGERSEMAEALLNYSRWLIIFNRVNDARIHTEEAEKLLKQIGSDTSDTSFLFAQIAWLNDDYQKSRSIYVELQAHFGLLGEKYLRSAAIENLGQLAMDQGDLDQAQAYLEQALATAREIEYEEPIAYRLVKLGIIFYLQRKIDKCKQYFKEGILIAKVLPFFRKTNILILMINYMYTQKLETSVHILASISNSPRESIRPIALRWKHYYDRVEAHARESLGDEAFESAFAEGQKMSLDEALDLALEIVDEM